MKLRNTICLMLSVILSAACGHEIRQSEFKEFEIGDRKGGIYLPAGYSTDRIFPVIYMEDGLVFKDCKFKHYIDSLVDFGIISPVVIACSYENKMKVPGTSLAFRNVEYIESLSVSNDEFRQIFEDHYKYFNDSFIPYIERNYSVSDSRDGRIYFGTSNSADFGITESFRNPSLFAEYWCYSPVYSDVSRYGMLKDKVSYRICWGAKEEIGQFDYFPELLKDIRKRGGSVHSWVFDGGHEREWWTAWFIEELSQRFAAN